MECRLRCPPPKYGMYCSLAAWILSDAKEKKRVTNFGYFLFKWRNKRSCMVMSIYILCLKLKYKLNIVQGYDVLEWPLCLSILRLRSRSHSRFLFDFMYCSFLYCRHICSIKTIRINLHFSVWYKIYIHIARIHKLNGKLLKVLQRNRHVTLKNINILMTYFYFGRMNLLNLSFVSTNLLLKT